MFVVGVSLSEKELQSRKTLKLAAEMSKTYYGEKLVLAYSGGKDSDVMLNLAEKELNRSDFVVVNSHTTVDAPQTVYYIKEVFKKLESKGIETKIIYPDTSMWKLIVKKGMPPTRLQRYCCQELKEMSIPNRLVSLGVRSSESEGRKGKDTFSIRAKTKDKALFFSLDHVEEVHREALEINDPVWDCTLIKTMRDHKDTIVNPIYEWTNTDVWLYIRQNNMKYNPLYDMGYSRVGCIGCPLGGYASQLREFADFPKYKELYIKAFDRMLAHGKEKGKDYVEGKEEYNIWETGEDVFDWWTGKQYRECYGQINIFDFMEG